MKKALSLVLVLVLALGMATVASAATKFKIDKGGDQINLVPEAKDGSGDEVDLGEIYVQSDTLKYYTEFIDFSKADPKDANPEPTKWQKEFATSGVLYLTESEIKDSKVTLKTVISKGAQTVKTGDTKIIYEKTNGSTNKYAQVRLQLQDELKTNNKDGVDFTVKFFLVVDGRQWNDSGLTYTGTLKNRTDNYSDASDGYVYMGDGVIIEADEYGRNIEMDLNNGVSVFGKMFKEKKYWAISNMDSYNDDEDLLMDKYDIDTVYHIKQVGVAAVADYVVLNDESSDMFVYDGELNYLGKGNDKLPFSETYYLSAKQLEVEEDEEPIDEDDEGDGYEVPGETGGDFYPENVNDNPGTGR